MGNKQPKENYNEPVDISDLYKPRIVILMPVKDDVKAMTTQSIAGAIIGAHEAGITVIDCVLRISCEIASARTWLINEAIRLGATHALFVDSDMVFKSDTIVKLLAHDKNIVAADYNKRTFPLELVSSPLTERKTDEIYQARHAATGMMLINLSIFEEEWVDPTTGKKAPWFSFGRDSQGNLSLGEDAWFCFSARDQGFETWIDPTIKVGHVGLYVY